MAPTSTLANSTLVPHAGTINPSVIPDVMDSGLGAVKAIVLVLTILGALGFVALLVFIVKRRNPKSPLPPIQTLAHHRERETDFLPRPYVPHKSMEFERDDGEKNEGESLAPLHTANVQTTDSLPVSSFVSPLVSSTSLTTGVYLSRPPVESPPDEQAIIGQEYVSTTRLARSSSLSRSRSRSRSKPELTRKPSVVSTRTVSTRTSTRSSNIIRGSAHSLHSNVEIVIPAPLAPQPRRHTSRDRSVTQGPRQPSDSRGSMGPDQWLKAPIRTTTSPLPTDQKPLEDDFSPKRQPSPCSTYQDPNYIATVVQPRQPELQPRSRGRSSSRPVVRPSGPGNPTISPQRSDDKIYPISIPSRLYDEQAAAAQSFPEPQDRCPTCAQPRPCALSETSTRRHQSLINALEIPSPQSTRSLAPPQNEQPPPPVPPLPRLPQPVQIRPDSSIPPLSPFPDVVVYQMSPGSGAPLVFRRDLTRGMLSPRSSLNSNTSSLRPVHPWTEGGSAWTESPYIVPSPEDASRDAAPSRRISYD